MKVITFGLAEAYSILRHRKLAGEIGRNSSHKSVISSPYAEQRWASEFAEH